MKSSGMAKAIALLLASAAGSVKPEGRPPKDTSPVDVAQFGMTGEERYVFCRQDCPRHSVKHKKLVEVSTLPRSVDEIPVKAPTSTTVVASSTLASSPAVAVEPAATTLPPKPVVKRRKKRKIHCPISH